MFAPRPAPGGSRWCASAVARICCMVRPHRAWMPHSALVGLPRRPSRDATPCRLPSGFGGCVGLRCWCERRAGELSGWSSVRRLGIPRRSSPDSVSNTNISCGTGAGGRPRRSRGRRRGGSRRDPYRGLATAPQPCRSAPVAAWATTSRVHVHADPAPSGGPAGVLGDRAQHRERLARGDRPARRSRGRSRDYCRDTPTTRAMSDPPGKNPGRSRGYRLVAGRHVRRRVAGECDPSQFGIDHLRQRGPRPGSPRRSCSGRRPSPRRRSGRCEHRPPAGLLLVPKNVISSRSAAGDPDQADAGMMRGTRPDRYAACRTGRR